MSKLETLMEIEGFKTFEELYNDAEYGMRVGVPAICMNDDCDYAQDMEPDQDEGWCSECGTNTLKSAYILKGII